MRSKQGIAVFIRTLEVIQAERRLYTRRAQDNPVFNANVRSAQLKLEDVLDHPIAYIQGRKMIL
jgi:hypothetical protein